jgi:phage regulator Rha-like protein
MTTITIGATAVTMTSREIAELTDKRHGNVMRDVRKMLSELYPEGASSDLSTPPDVAEYHRGDRTQYKFLTQGAVDAFMEFGKSGPLTVALFEAVYTDAQNGQFYPEFRLPKRETLVLIAGYSVPLRARIIDRWQELEAQATVVRDPMEVLRDPVSMRTLLLGYTEKVLALEHQVGELTPKAEALDLFVTASDGSFCLPDAAKALQVPPRKFVTRLQQMG